MAHYDEITETNWLTKKEKVILKSTVFFIIFCVVDFFLLIFKAVRNYHFDNFPNLHFIGIILLFIIVVFRISQAYEEGKDPYMEASMEWRERKGMVSAYDYGGAGPDFSNKKYNILYYIGVLTSICLMTIEIFKNFSQ